MHYVPEKHRRRVSLWVILLSALTLAFAAVYVLVGGISLANTETAAAFDLKGRLLGYSIGFFFVNIFFAGWAWSVVRKNKHRWASYTYSGMLYVAAGLFVALAIRFPQIKKETERNLRWECDNTTSDLHEFDKLYTAANAILCTPACPCNTDTDRWQDQKFTFPRTIVNTTSNNQPLADRFTQCPNGNRTISYGLRNTNYSKPEDFNYTVTALKAIEVDFKCASYCDAPPSRYRTFSWVGNGPVAHNCTSQINDWMHDTAKSVSTLFWILFSIVTFCATYVLAFACRKHNEMESPLLVKQNF